VPEARHELIPLEEPGRWGSALAGVAYGHAHTWGFCRAIQRTSALPTFLYSYTRGDDRVVCPLSERTYNGEADVATPYGFGGFASRGPCEQFAADWRGFAQSRRWVCGYVALNPMLAVPPALPAAELRCHNELYLLDLRCSEANMMRRLSANRRRQLRDWPAVAPQLLLEHPRLACFLVDTYADFFRRRGGGQATRLSAETMAEIAALDDVVLAGVQRDGAVEAVAVFGRTIHGGDYLFNVSVPGGERHAAYLVWWGAHRLRQDGVPWLNLGGGIQAGDSVAEFKRRFGAVRRPLMSLRQIYRPLAYRRLCREAGVEPMVDGYFPAYRRT
jgi:hypothetical protein